MKTSSKRGAPARAIQELARHTALAMPQRYMHLSPAALDVAMRLLEEPAGRLHAGGAFRFVERRGRRPRDENHQ